MDLTTQHAKILADNFAKIGGTQAFAGIYCDAVVVYLAVSTETQDRIENALRQILLASGRSRDGFCCALLIKPPGLDDWTLPATDEPEFVALQIVIDKIADVASSGATTDNRCLDLDTVESYVAFIEKWIRQ